MSAMQAEVFEAFRSIDVPEDKALKAATALSSALTKFETDTSSAFNKRDADMDAGRRDIGVLRTDMDATRRDIGVLKTDMDATRKDVGVLKTDMDAARKDIGVLRTDIEATRKDVGVLKTDMAVLKWMMGFVLAFQVLMFGKMFMH